MAQAAAAAIEGDDGDGNPGVVMEVQSPPRPDWTRSPLYVSVGSRISLREVIDRLTVPQVAMWSDDDDMRDFEGNLYNFGFEPSAKGL